MEILLICILVIALVAMLYLYNKVRVELKSTKKCDYMMRAFLQNISSEIRSPLKVINKIADVVSKPDLYLSKNEKSDMGDQLHYNAGVIISLLNEVMVFTDADSNHYRLKDEVFSPNALCRRSLEANQNNVYRRENVKLHFMHELSDEFFIKSDRHVVDLIVNKLILNACRFTEEGDVTVGCNTSENPGWLTVFVSDTGKGIPAQRRENIFTWFDTPEDMFDAAELDLSICMKLANKLGGELQLDQMHQRGTRVLLLLPIKK